MLQFIWLQLHMQGFFAVVVAPDWPAFKPAYMAAY